MNIITATEEFIKIHETAIAFFGFGMLLGVLFGFAISYRRAASWFESKIPDSFHFYTRKRGHKSYEVKTVYTRDGKEITSSDWMPAEEFHVEN